MYKGPHIDHFKRVLEAYNTLKNPVKRKDYDQKLKIKRRTESAEEESKFVNEDGEFDAKRYEEYKRKHSTVRNEIDPEFIEELKKYNFSRMFR